MSETLNITSFEDTETDFNDEAYNFNIDALKMHYSANEMGRHALSGLVELESEE